MERILLQASINQSYQLAKYFLSENKPLIPRILIYVYIYRKIFDFDINDIKIPRIHTDFFLIQKTVNSFFERFKLGLLEFIPK